jgi:hypothetical protein
MSGVFIAYMNKQNMYVVEPVPRIDQVYSYYAFMSNPEIPQLHFNYPTSKTPIIYDIKKYIDETHGNPGRFCIYKSESPGQRILSDNKEALDEYVKNKEAANLEAAERARAARMFNKFGGNRTKHSRNRKTKRVHTSKRK